MGQENERLDLTESGKTEIMERSLNDFAREVGIVCALEAGGKIEPQEAYKRIRKMWKELKRTKKSLYPKVKKGKTGEEAEEEATQL